MSLNQFTGSPWHVERWHRDDDEKRRHRSNCKYFRKEGHYCRYNKIPCYGSAHCSDYKEKEDKETSNTAINFVDSKSSSKNSGSELIKQAKKQMPVGSNVHHKRFGDGLVVGYEDEYIIIHFYELTEKKKLRIMECYKNNQLIIVE